MLRLTTCVIAACVLLGISAVGQARPAPLYNIVKHVAIGSPDWWDYLTYDDVSGRLYVAHGDRVTVVDGDSGKIIGEVKGIPGGTHGIVISHATNTGYTDDGKAGEVVAFDLKKLEVIGTIKAEADADGLVLDPVSHHIFVVDSDPGKLTVIDPASNRPIDTIDAGGKLEFAVADGRGSLFANGEEKRDIVRVDVASNRVLAHWPIPMCHSPHGLAIDEQSHRLFASCHNNTLVVVDADNGHVVTTLPIDGFTDAAAFDPKRHRVFSSNGQGTITVIAEKGPDNYSIIDTVKTRLGARTMSINPKTGRLFVVAANYFINKAAAPDDIRHRYKVEPGSAELIFLDPTD